MIKLAIPAVIGLLLGLGVSTGAVVFLSGGGSLGEDLETAMVDENGDTIHAEAEGEHAEEPTEADSSHAADGHAVEGDEAALAAAAATGLTEGSIEEVVRSEPDASSALTALATAQQQTQSNAMSTTQLAGLYGTMSPREAAKVLEHMDDGEVQMILAALESRKAAAILSNLTPERAAAVSRSVLGGERSSN